MSSNWFLGIVALLFCGITLKHYAYFNMSRRTQLATKYIFQVLAQLSENFIFIYLGLALFTEKNLVYQPLLIIVTVLAVCAARWVAVFPLSRAINWFIRYRARRRGMEAGDELPYSYQVMLFWAGLRGAVGVALSALFTAKETQALQATVLVVVVLTVIIFGGTTARMLEILGIRTGVADDNDSDDEFDIEAIGGGGVYKRTDTGVGYTPHTGRGGAALPLNNVGPSGSASGDRRGRNGWASGHHSPNAGSRSRKSPRLGASHNEYERTDLLGPTSSTGGSSVESDFGSDIDISDLPPPANNSRTRSIPSPLLGPSSAATPSSGTQAAGGSSTTGQQPLTATAAIRQLLSAENPTALLRQLDEEVIKPKLLLDAGSGRGGPGGSGSH